MSICQLIKLVKVIGSILFVLIIIFVPKKFGSLGSGQGIGELWSGLDCWIMRIFLSGEIVIDDNI